MKLHVVGENMHVSEDVRDYVTRRLEFALGRFTPEVERVGCGLGTSTAHAAAWTNAAAWRSSYAVYRAS